MNSEEDLRLGHRQVPGGSDFREFVVIDQNMVANNTVNYVGAINYRSEPFGLRGPKPQPTTPPKLPKGPTEGYSQAYSNRFSA